VQGGEGDGNLTWRIVARLNIPWNSITIGFLCLIKTSKNKRGRASFDLTKPRQGEILKEESKAVPLVCLHNSTINQLYILSLESAQRIFPDNETVEAEV
jgi:hypothetical protein